MKIAVIGTGYVGLVSGACLSDFGHDVVCVDNNKEKIKDLKKGVMPIYEAGLEDLVVRNQREGRLSFTTDIKEAVDDATAVFICVGTPQGEDGDADLSYVKAVAKELAPLLVGNKRVVSVKSTVPPKTNRRVRDLILEENPDANFEIASNPEFLREGSSVEDFMRPDRVIIGVDSDFAKETMQEIYDPLYVRLFPIVYTSLESAELIKYASNALLALKVGFINEIANISEKIGGDIKEISHGVGLDNRIGNKFLKAGPGYGGSCFPKDTQALAYLGSSLNVPQMITEAVINSNEYRKYDMVYKIREAVGYDAISKLKGKKIAVFGVTFKANTDDLRDSPALLIVPSLVEYDADVVVVDPEGKKFGKDMIKGVKWKNNPYKAAEDADAVVIITDWNQFRALDLKKLKKKMKGNVLVDLRNIYDPKKAVKVGFKYEGIGR